MADDRLYWRKRANDEDLKAQAAETIAAREAHEQLAMLYRRRPTPGHDDA